MIRLNCTSEELKAALEAGGLTVYPSWPIETEAALAKYEQWCPDHTRCEITEYKHGAGCNTCMRAFTAPGYP